MYEVPLAESTVAGCGCIEATNSQATVYVWNEAHGRRANSPVDTRTTPHPTEMCFVAPMDGRLGYLAQLTAASYSGLRLEATSRGPWQQ